MFGSHLRHRLASAFWLTLAGLPIVGVGTASASDDASPPPERTAPAQTDPMQPRNCPQAAERARILGTPAKLDYPEAALRANVKGFALVVVAIDGTGFVQSVSIMHSTGNASLDGSAMAAAAETVYRPEMRFCLGVPSRYIFKADFTGR